MKMEWGDAGRVSGKRQNDIGNLRYQCDVNDKPLSFNLKRTSLV